MSAISLKSYLAQRILILDGAMGTMIFSLGIDEVTMRGERFANHHKDLKNFVDIIALTHPDTLTGKSTVGSWRLVPTLSKPTHSVPAPSAWRSSASTGVGAGNQLSCGSLCSTGGGRVHRSHARQASVRCLAPSVPRPRRRRCHPTWKIPATVRSRLINMSIRTTSKWQALVEGGVDILFPETTFDTLNLKAVYSPFREIS